MQQDQKINNQSHQIAEVSLMDLWQVIARYYYVVLISVLLSVISAFLYIYSAKEEAPQPIYHASATLESGHYISIDNYGTLEQKFLDFKINNELEQKINNMLNQYKKVNFDSLTREQMQDWNIGDTLFSLSISTRSLIIKSASKVSHELPVSLISKVVDFIQTEDTSFLESSKNPIKQKIKKLEQEINSKAEKINSKAQEIELVEKQLEHEIREMTIPWIQRGIYIERKIEYLEKQKELYLQQIAINEKLLANPLEGYQILKNYDGPNITMIIQDTDYRYQNSESKLKILDFESNINNLLHEQKVRKEQNFDLTRSKIEKRTFELESRIKALENSKKELESRIKELENSKKELESLLTEDNYSNSKIVGEIKQESSSYHKPKLDKNLLIVLAVLFGILFGTTLTFLINLLKKRIN